MWTRHAVQLRMVCRELYAERNKERKKDFGVRETTSCVFDSILCRRVVCLMELGI